MHKTRHIPFPITAEQAAILNSIRQRAALCRKLSVETATEDTREIRKWTLRRVQMILAAILATTVLFGAARQISASQNTQPDCRFDAGPCVRTAGALSVVLDIAPKPLKVMSELTFTVTVKDKDQPVKDATILISLSMPGMYMGENIIQLAHRANGVYEGTGVIVRCPSGEKIWQASVTIERGAKKSVANYVFEVP